MSSVAEASERLSKVAKLANEDGVVFLPDTMLLRRGINPRAVAPSWLKNKTAILDGVEALLRGDMAEVYGGRAAKGRELTVVGRGAGKDPIMIVHDKETEVAELEDLALEALERKPIDFAASRERNGKPDKATFDQRVRERAQAHIDYARSHRVTYKPRDPMQQYVKGLVTVPASPIFDKSRNRSE